MRQAVSVLVQAVSVLFVSSFIHGNIQVEVDDYKDFHGDSDYLNEIRHFGLNLGRLFFSQTLTLRWS